MISKSANSTTLASATFGGVVVLSVVVAGLMSVMVLLVVAQSVVVSELMSVMVLVMRCVSMAAVASEMAWG